MQSNSERWLPVVGYEGLYEVSDHGRVWSAQRVIKRGQGTMTIRGKMLTSSTANGYQVLNLWCNGKPTLSRVHRLVLEAFVGPCPDGMEGCHNDGDPTNNLLSNLRWDTSGANKFDTVLHGRHVQARKTHCPHGHPYNADNTYSPPGRPRIRYCQTCRKWHQKKTRERQRARRSQH